MRVMGSSPLARGLRGGGVDDRLGPGIIPARAGFTGSMRSPKRTAGDHPRSRGVYPAAVIVDGDFAGSSPLARGLPRRRRPRHRRGRIIPARAGFTASRRGRGGGWPDHPRSRGVYSSRPRRTSTRPGSSPLARGLLGEGRPQRLRRRIIPARAGFTCSTRSARSPQEDHPRSRGVYLASHRSAMALAGSSPLARGLRSTRPPDLAV